MSEFKYKFLILEFSVEDILSFPVGSDIPKKSWNKLHLQIIYYGREYCKARDSYGVTCKICTTCYPNMKKPLKTKKA